MRHHDEGISAIAGPEGLMLRTPIGLHGKDMHTEARFRVGAGDRSRSVLTWYDPVRSRRRPWTQKNFWTTARRRGKSGRTAAS